ncbi:P-loop NTPase fold protein [Sphingobacterium sp.]|uniref:P-loop NTPase fold protein n=1 Tax=Sphingobacterium sp. TaxID=341027 RepID=UPI0031DCD027
MESIKNYRLKIDELDKFLVHIENENNTDIIFSAPFGTGKTYFLIEEFAESEEVKSFYNVIHLFPVNYSIASNEDIFSLIKYDILIELKKKYIPSFDVESTRFSKLLTFQSYLNHEFKPISFLKDLMLKSGLINKAPFEVYNLFANEYKKLNSYHEDITKGDDKSIIEAIEELSGEIPFKEMDPISILIKELGDNIRGDKKNILIIDDLDRIDPEHIFRIINVFSAHRDYETKEHKYGFDKVVLVCDIENIKRIYQHKYGIGVDFNGYISKFASTEAFHYNVRNYLSNALDKFFLNSEYFSVDDSLLADDSPYRSYNFAAHNNLRHNSTYQLFKLFVNFLIDIGKINIRDLTKPYRFEVRNTLLKGRKGEDFLTIDFPILILIDYIDTLLGSRRSFFNIVNECNKKGYALSYRNSPSQFQDPQSIMIQFIEEVLTLSIMPSDELKNTYSIFPKENIPGLHGSYQNGPILINYISEYNYETKSYFIKIKQQDLNWEVLTFYNINLFLIEKLDEFYNKYPHY